MNTVVAAEPVRTPDPAPQISAAPVIVAELVPDGIEVLFPDPDGDQPTSTLPQAHKRSRRQREEDLAVIAQLMAKKTPQTKITDHLNTLRHGHYSLSRAQIIYDVKEIDRRYKEKHLKPLQIAKARELEHLDHLEQEAFAAWERSQQPSQSQKVEAEEKKQTDGTIKSVPVKKTQETEKRDGDAAFLNVLVKLSERRAKILGLDAPIKQDIKVEDKGAEALTHDALWAAFRRRYPEVVGPKLIENSAA